MRSAVCLSVCLSVRPSVSPKVVLTGFLVSVSPDRVRVRGRRFSIAVTRWTRST